MTFDICFVTYNSSKWLINCVAAFSKLNFDKKKVSLYFADNASTDNTLQCLQSLKQENANTFSNFEILQSKTNMGFGGGSNLAARAGKSDMVFFCNVDTEIDENAMLELEKAIQSSEESFAAFELRQFPYEHPKYYNPITLEASWASGACFVLRRNIFEKTKGFDETIFMYGEDVELSWRIRSLGYKIKYVPSAIINHYAYKEAGEVKPTQMAGSLVGNLVLRYKYGRKKDIQKWHKLYAEALPHIGKILGVEDEVKKHIKGLEDREAEYRDFYESNIKNSRFKPSFLGLDYEFARGGAFYANHLPKGDFKFSVIVRTYQRPKLLALTLQSLTNQTYKNFEVIVVEDGVRPVSEKATLKEKSSLDISYVPMNKNAGRCVAGNAGVAAAKGDFILFLDDDDYFFAEQLEVMACLAEENQDAQLVALGAIEARCVINPSDPTIFTFKTMKNMGKDKLKAIDFCTDNPLPIQAIAFHKALTEKYGALDPQLDALEDWDMWLRFVSKAKLVSVDKAASIYKLPNDENAFLNRNAIINSYRAKVYEKMAEYNVQVSAQDIYSILWQPPSKLTGINNETEINDYKSMQSTAKEIINSNTWKASLPLRFIPRALSEVFGYLSFVVNFFLGKLCQLLALIGKAFSAIYYLFRTAADFIAPKKIDTSKANEESLHSFIILYKNSFIKKMSEKLSKKDR